MRTRPGGEEFVRDRPQQSVGGCCAGVRHRPPGREAPSPVRAAARRFGGRRAGFGAAEPVWEPPSRFGTETGNPGRSPGPTSRGAPAAVGRGAYPSRDAPHLPRRPDQALRRRRPALDELTLDLEPGIIGLVGANGAGKSTLIKLLLGLLEPTAGTARVIGLDVRHNGPRSARRVGYMPEHDCLPPDVSATDFVGHMARMSGLPRTAARERTAEVLRHVGLYEERYRPIGGYSTGMKQRVKLAQALVHDPRLLLLDEPTNGLDPAGRDEMLELIRRTGTEFGIAVILASHLLGEIERVCDLPGGASTPGACCGRRRCGTFTQRTGVLAVEVEEGAEALAAALDRARARRSSSTAAWCWSRSPTSEPTTWCATRVVDLGLLAGAHRAPPAQPRGPLPGRGAGGMTGPSAAPDTSGRAPNALVRASGPGGSIYDLGYQGYDGPRLGRAAAIRALFGTRCGRATASAVAPGPRSCRSPWPRWPSCRPSSASASPPLPGQTGSSARSSSRSRPSGTRPTPASSPCS